MFDETCNPKLYEDVKFFPGGNSLWEIASAAPFKYLLASGMRESSTVLDAGCGPLRVGRNLIMFLAPGNYCGLEPERTMIDRGLLEPPLTPEIIDYKRPRFVSNSTFDIDGEFDIVLSNQVFFHCGREQLVTFLEKMRSHVLDSIVITVFIGEADADYHKSGFHEHFDYRFSSHGTIVYAESSFRSLVAGCGYSAEPLGTTWMPFEQFWRLRKA